MGAFAIKELSRSEINKLRGLQDSLGLSEAAARIGVHHSTLTRAIAGLKIRPTAAQCLRSRLHELAESALSAAE